jgi:hypothetical protein
MAGDVKERPLRPCGWCDYVLDHLRPGVPCPECGNAVPEHEVMFLGLPEGSIAELVSEFVGLGVLFWLFFYPWSAARSVWVAAFVPISVLSLWRTTQKTPLVSRWMAKRMHILPDGFVLRNRWGLKRFKWGKSDVVTVSAAKAGVWVYVTSWLWRRASIKVSSSETDAGKISERIRHVVSQAGSGIIKPAVRDDYRW